MGDILEESLKLITNNLKLLEKEWNNEISTKKILELLKTT